MKKEALIAKYRIKDENIGFRELKRIGGKPESYIIPVNGNICKVMVSKVLGIMQISASVITREAMSRIPTYEECLIIKDTLFEESENLVICISDNPLTNLMISNPSCIHIYMYTDKMPPIEKIIAIQDYIKDGNYKIKSGTIDGWEFLKISGDVLPDLLELKRIRDKHLNQKDVIIFFVEGAIILFNYETEKIIISNFKKI